MRYYLQSLLILLFILKFGLESSRCQEPDIKFNRFVVEDGLTSINCIVNDSKGFMWFGGSHGLYRFDGYEFKIFTNNPNDSSSICGNNIIDLYPEENGLLWIGTSNRGMCLYNPEKENFIIFPEIGDISVTSICRDHQGFLWVGTLGKGIYVFDRENKFVDNYRYQSSNNSSVSNNEIFDIYEDNFGRIWVTSNSGSLDLYDRKSKSFARFIFNKTGYQAVRTGQKILCDFQGYFWIGTEGDGLYRFDEKDKSFRHYLQSDNQTNSLSNNIITGIAESVPGKIWITTDGGGLNLLDTKTFEFQHFKNNPLDINSLTNNSSYCIFIDKHQTIWTGMGDGIVDVSINSPFRIYEPSAFSNSLSFRVVVALCLARNDKLWIGTGGGGLDVFDIKKHIFKNYQHNPQNNNSISTDIILALCEDKNGCIWAGTFLGGADLINPKTGIITHFRNEPGNTNSLANDHIFGILEDHAGNMWFATMGGGLDCYEPHKREFTHFRHHPGELGLSSDKVRCLMEDNQHRLWIGTDKGAQIINLENRKFIEDTASLGMLDRLKNTAVHDIMEDSDGNEWFATNDLGLCMLNLKSGKCETFGVQNGMPSNSVYGVFEDRDHFIWSCTNNGIVRYNPLTKKIMILNRDDGLPTNDFEAGSIKQAHSGELFFSSKKGLISFFPEKIEQSTEQVEVTLTGLRIFNKLVSPGQKVESAVPLENSISFTKELVLPYYLNNISFEFAAPGFHNPAKIEYQYQMDGADNRWIETGPNRRIASYSDLRPGDYTFRIKGANSVGVWGSKETLIKVSILPPFWKTRWAYFIYIVVAMTILFLILREYTNRIKLKHQLELEKYRHEKDNELNVLKIGFYTNISHELRTPLTLILGPLERMINNIHIDNMVRHQLMVVQRNGQRLLHLVNQLLDFRKLESGKMQLQVEKADLISFMNEIVLSFQDMAIQKNIEFKVKFGDDSIIGFIDKSKVEIMVFNLLSNAFKFTSPNGKVQLELEPQLKDNNSWIKIIVSDSGEGINQDKLDHVFELFYQNSDSKIKGSGIGLALTKSLVELHHGEIEVESKSGEGSRFSITLPSSQGTYTENEFLKSSLENKVNLVQQKISSRHNPVVNNDGKLPLLLIVEDNLDLNDFISNGFSGQFKILKSFNGVEGLNMAKEKVPDVIISDVMMPEMDGVELCRKIKQDITTSHIPVILLTARSADIFQLEGLENGADDYITKPFSFELLSARVANIIEMRKKLQERFKREFILSPKELAITNPDEIFLEKLAHVIDTNISNPNLDIEFIAREIGMSHSTLYRKLLALTGKKINDFIRTYRLQRAAELLEKSDYSIDEISDNTGFSSPKYFSTCFKKEYGTSPSTYKSNKI